MQCACSKDSRRPLSIGAHQCRVSQELEGAGREPLTTTPPTKLCVLYVSKLNLVHEPGDRSSSTCRANSQYTVVQAIAKEIQKTQMPPPRHCSETLHVCGRLAVGNAAWVLLAVCKEPPLRAAAICLVLCRPWVPCNTMNM